MLDLLWFAVDQVFQRKLPDVTLLPFVFQQKGDEVEEGVTSEGGVRIISILLNFHLHFGQTSS